MGDQKGPLVIWDKKWGTITAQNYVSYVLRPQLVPYFQERRDETQNYVYFQQDGAPVHRARATMQFLQEEGVSPTSSRGLVGSPRNAVARVAAQIRTQEPHDKVPHPAPLLERPPRSGTPGGVGRPRPGEHLGPAVEPTVGKKATPIPGALWGWKDGGERGRRRRGPGGEDGWIVWECEERAAED